MRIHQRRLSALMVAASVGVATILAGCDSGASTASSKTITLWTTKTAEVPALQAVAADFKKSTGVTVVVQATTPDAAYNTKVEAAARTKTLPDIVSTGSPGFTYAQSGITIDLSQYFDQQWQKELYPSAVQASILTQAAVDASKTDASTALTNLTVGHVYAIPYLAGSAGIIVANKQKLAAAGVDTSRPPASWEEFVADMKKTVAMDPTNGGIVTGLKNDQTGLEFLYHTLAYEYLGLDAYENRLEKSPTSPWNSPRSIDTLTFYSQVTPYWKPGVFNLDIDPADQAFASGQAAWDVGGSFTLSYVLQNGLTADNIMAFPVPAPQGSAVTDLKLTASPLLSFGVTATSKDVSDSVAFLKYLSSTSGAETFARLAHDIPATALPGNDPALGSILQPMISALSTDASGGFQVYDSSKEPANGANSVQYQADQLALIAANKATPAAVANNLTAYFAKAWGQAQ